jgi:hypothetical protein
LQAGHFAFRGRVRTTPSSPSHLGTSAQSRADMRRSVPLSGHSASPRALNSAKFRCRITKALG